MKTLLDSITPVKSTTPNTYESVDRFKDGFNVTDVLMLTSSCDNQPFWRDRTDLAHAYVDGKQLTPAQEQSWRAEGLGDYRPTNLIGRVIRSVCGQEAKSRTGVKVESDEDESFDVADVMNVRMAEARRETYADMAVSDAYFDQTVGGIGWVGVFRNDDPLGYRYKVENVHYSEIWWDWLAQDRMLRDARWVIRKRWVDQDEIQARMPQHAKLLENMTNNWSSFVWDDTVDEAMRIQYHSGQRWNSYQRRVEWYDGVRKRVKLYEIWYRVPAMALVLKIGHVRKVLFDPQNQAHLQGLQSGAFKLTRELTTQVRMSLFAGPHRLQDLGTTKRNFPYIPFFAYRDNDDLSPYGLVEGMISPQDEYNSRRMRINWMLRARQILVDNDALDKKANSLEQIVQRIMRPDLTVVLDPNRRNANGFQVLSNLTLQKEQVDVMQDAKQLIQDVPGVYGSQLGQAASGVTSGIANSLLIEQGAVAMGDLNDNYRMGRQGVYEALLDCIVDDYRTGEIPVRMGSGDARRVIVLNQFNPDTGEIVNNVGDAPTRVGLGEVPNTPAYRMQQQQQVATIITALSGDPQAVALLTPSFIEATDHPDRMQIAADFRRLKGIPSAADRRAQEQAAKAQAAEQERMKKMADAAAQLELEGKAAEVLETKSKAKLNEAKVFEIGHNMGTQHAPQPPQGTGGPGASDMEDDEDALINEAIGAAARAVVPQSPAAAGVPA